jgi:hypothetical protein
MAGLADQGRAVHHRRGIGEGAGDPDADRARAAEQRIGVGTGGMALDQHLALEGIALRSVGAGVKQIGIAAEDLAVTEQDHAAALAGPAILQADVDRIQAVFHDAPGATRVLDAIDVLLCQSGARNVNAAG